MIYNELETLSRRIIVCRYSLPAKQVFTPQWSKRIPHWHSLFVFTSGMIKQIKVFRSALGLYEYRQFRYHLNKQSINHWIISLFRVHQLKVRWDVKEPLGHSNCREKCPEASLTTPTTRISRHLFFRTLTSSQLTRYMSESELTLARLPA